MPQQNHYHTRSLPKRRLRSKISNLLTNEFVTSRAGMITNPPETRSPLLPKRTTHSSPFVLHVEIVGSVLGKCSPRHWNAARTSTASVLRLRSLILVLILLRLPCPLAVFTYRSNITVGVVWSTGRIAGVDNTVRSMVKGPAARTRV